MQVFDGHSGSGAAQFAKGNLCDYFAEYLQADSLQPNEMQEAMVSFLYVLIVPLQCMSTYSV